MRKGVCFGVMISDRGDAIAEGMGLVFLGRGLCSAAHFCG